MIVVSDSTPINYLVQMGLIDLLKRLHSRVYLPSTVRDELVHAGAPEQVREWASHPPHWIVVQTVPKVIPDTLRRLDPGERAAIALALEISAERVLIDDYAGRQVAIKLGLIVAGTLSILRDAANEGWVDYDSAIQNLLGLGFRASAQTIEDARPSNR